jgi:NADH ubiquinone oxidoreductase, 20 Kd subunit
MAAVDLPAPRRGGGMAADLGVPDLGVPDLAGPVEVGGFSLRVLDAGLACCAVEVSAALRRCAELLPDGGSGPGEGSDLGSSAEPGQGSGPAEKPGPGEGPGPAEGSGPGEGPGPAEGSGPGGGPSPVNVLVVAGTVTDKLAPLVLAAYRDLPEPRRVLSFGACSNSGGPYWDSYCVTKGADQLIPVDVYVPGCPPRPEALVHGLRLLRDVRGEQR